MLISKAGRKGPQLPHIDFTADRKQWIGLVVEQKSSLVDRMVHSGGNHRCCLVCTTDGPLIIRQVTPNRLLGHGFNTPEE